MKDGDIKLIPVIRDGHYLYIDEKTGEELVPQIFVHGEWVDIHLARIGTDEMI